MKNNNSFIHSIRINHIIFIFISVFLLSSCDKGSSKVTFKILDNDGNYTVLMVKDVMDGEKIDNPISGVTWIENDYSQTKFPTQWRYKDTIDMYLPVKYANVRSLDSMSVESNVSNGINYSGYRQWINPSNGNPTNVRFNFGYGLIEKPRVVNLENGVNSDITVYGLFPITDEMKETGKNAYNRSCLPCHGADGDARGPRFSVAGGPEFYISLIRKIVQDNNNTYLGTYHKYYVPKDFHEVECLTAYITTQLYKGK